MARIRAVFQLGDAFLTEISAARTITFSTFLGGSSADWATSVALDGQGGVIITGGTSSTNFPATKGAYQTKYGGIDLPVPSGMRSSRGGATRSWANSIDCRVQQRGQLHQRMRWPPGKLFLIAGTLIGPATLARAQLTPAGAVSSMVANTQFLFDGVPAPIVYVSSG